MFGFGAKQRVKGYVRRDGTEVSGYERTSPANGSAPPNVRPDLPGGTPRRAYGATGFLSADDARAMGVEASSTLAGVEEALPEPAVEFLPTAGGTYSVRSNRALTHREVERLKNAGVVSESTRYEFPPGTSLDVFGGEKGNAVTRFVRRRFVHDPCDFPPDGLSRGGSRDWKYRARVLKGELGDARRYAGMTKAELEGARIRGGSATEVERLRREAESAEEYANSVRDAFDRHIAESKIDVNAVF